MLTWQEIEPVPGARRTWKLVDEEGRPVDGSDVDDDVWGFELDITEREKPRPALHRGCSRTTSALRRSRPSSHCPTPHGVSLESHQLVRGFLVAARLDQYLSGDGKVV